MFADTLGGVFFDIVAFDQRAIHLPWVYTWAHETRSTLSVRIPFKVIRLMAMHIFTHAFYRAAYYLSKEEDYDIKS